MLPKPPDDYQEQEAAEALFKRFVYERVDGVPTPLPKRFDPAQADELVQKALDAGDVNDRQVAQCGSLMRFYDLRGRAEQLTQWLNRGEKDRPEVVRSETAVALLGDLGNEDLQKKAADYYQHLASQRRDQPGMERLLKLFAHLPEDADPKWFSDPIDKRMADLRPEIGQNIDAEIEYKQLEQLKDSWLPGILAVKKRREDILKLKNPDRRRAELARCYLGLQDYPHVDMRMWAVMILQRECNAGEPAALAKAFSHMFDLLMSPAGVTERTGRVRRENLKVYVTSCARGVTFYQGTLNEKQAEFAAKHGVPEQYNILYWEPVEEKARAG